MQNFTPADNLTTTTTITTTATNETAIPAGISTTIWPGNDSSKTGGNWTSVPKPHAPVMRRILKNDLELVTDKSQGTFSLISR